MEGKISKRMKIAPKLGNTKMIYNEVSRKLLQAHCERIADFLVEGEDCYWKRIEGGIEFLDSNDDGNRAEPKLQHFRSSLENDVHRSLEQSWCKVVDMVKEGTITCPLEKLVIYEDGEIKEKISKFND